jgi:hypothetical protein
LIFGMGQRARKLFAAVVLAALDDAIADDKKYGNGPDQIARWARSRDGREVLTCAGIDPNERVVEGLMKFVANGVRTSVALSREESERRNLVVDFDPGTQAFWCRFQAPGRQVFSAEMLSELLLWRDRVAEHAAVVGAKFHVMASGRPGVFNRGGDLELLSRLIRDHDRAGLMDYGNSCVDMVWANHIGWDAGLTTIAVVEGDALGGGLEAALSSDIVIAERGVRMGFPEVRFDLFPGMGAYSFLSRRIGGHAAWHLPADPRARGVWGSARACPSAHRHRSLPRTPAGPSWSAPGAPAGDSSVIFSGRRGPTTGCAVTPNISCRRTLISGARAGIVDRDRGPSGVVNRAGASRSMRLASLPAEVKPQRLQQVEPLQLLPRRWSRRRDVARASPRAGPSTRHRTGRADLRALGAQQGARA